MIKEDLTNRCCIAWKDKYSKLKDGYTKLEDRRNALRRGLSIYEEQVSKMQAENLSLRKNLEDEKVRKNNEVEEKIKESALRVSLESEVAGLKNEILSLKKKLVADDGGREIRELKEHLSERETKINELKELVKKERVRAESEKKKAEFERKKADDLRTKLKIEKTRANEERRLADTDRKRAEVNRLSLENLKKEADQVKSKLALVIFEFEDAKKKLEAERENTSKERKRADAAGMKTVEQKKIAEANRKMAMDEKSRATALFWQLEQDRQKVDNLKKEIGELMASGKMANIVSSEGTTVGTAQLSSELGPVAVDRDVTMVDVDLNSDAAQRKLQEMELRVVDEKKRVKSEMKKVEKQRKAAEAYKKKASEEKDRADQLSEAVENYRKQVEELQKEIKKLISTRSLTDCPLHMSDSNVHVETGNDKLLKKQLKFEKKLVKHVKKVAKLEKAHSNDTIQQQSLLSIKQEVVHFLRRLNMLDGCLFQDDEHDLEKVCSFNLKNNYSGLKARDMHRHLGNDSMKLAAVVSDPSKQKIKRSVPSLPICGGNNPESISGINSKLEPLLRGSNKKVLQSSAMNSSSASFSNRLLVGSQERCASISSSAKSAEGKLDIEPTISSLSGDARKKCNENVLAIAESNVKSPVSCIYNERTASHHKRMSRSIDAIEYNGNLNSKGNKWQRQLSQKISLHDGMLNSITDRLHDEKKHLVADIRHDLFSEHFRSTKKRKTSCELGLQLLNNNSAAKTKFDSSGVKSDVCAHQSPNVYSLPETAQDCKDGEHDDLVDIDELVGGEYIKLLNLDNDTDEESYRLAIEMPLSPTLPEIQCHSSVALVPINTPLYEGFLNARETVASSGNFDVINVEINSNKVKHPTIDPPKKSSLPEKKDHVDSSKRLNLDTACKLSCSSDPVTLEALCRSDLAAPATEGLQISSERRAVSLQDGFAKYCVIFSNNNDAKTISSVYHATSRCLAQCSVSSDTSLRSILVTLLNLQEISNEEKTCVFFSLLLLYISETATRAFRDDWERDLILFINSVAQHIYTELSHEDMRRIFVESCNLYDVLSLMEDFLLHGKLLVHAVSSDSELASNSGIHLILDGHSISLCKKLAPTQLLLTGGILLASVCAAFDHIGFVCEASCNILRTLRSDALNILHIFAYLCGTKYITLKEYGLAMTVVKSLVMLIHNNRSSPNPLSCVATTVESLSKICSGSKCPFSESAATMDVVASSLLDSLKSYCCSAVGLDLMESLNSSRYGIKCYGKRTDESTDNVDLVQWAYVTLRDSSQFIDTLALMELVAGFMSWDWTFDKIACPLLKLLEYCSTEHNAAAITTLLGQLGRSGLEAFGYEDVRIQRLRSSFCALLSQCDSKRMDLHLQFSIGIALVGLIPLRFEELVGSNIEVAPAANPTDCLRKWFSLLSSEQRLLFKARIFC